MNFSHTHIIALLLVVIAAKLFFDHRKKDYEGPYRIYGNYEKVSWLKHDLFKTFVVQLFPLLVVGLSSGEKFWDAENPFNSWIGKAIAIASGFFVYHELVLPYIVNKMPYW